MLAAVLGSTSVPLCTEERKGQIQVKAAVACSNTTSRYLLHARESEEKSELCPPGFQPVSDAHLYNKVYLSAGFWRLEECSCYMFRRVLCHLQGKTLSKFDINVTFSVAIKFVLCVGLQLLFTATFRPNLVQRKILKMFIPSVNLSFFYT